RPEVARVVAVEHDAPGLRVRVRVAQGRERDADLQRPAFGRDAAGRVPVEVGRGVFTGGIVGDRVVLDAVGVGQEEDRRLARVARVEDDAAVIRVAGDVVAVAQRRAD